MKASDLFVRALEAEGVEHLDCAHGDPVGLTNHQRSRLAFDDPGRESGEGGQLCSQCQSGRTGADDQNIDFAWKLPGRGRVRGIAYIRVARPEAVQVKLHVAIFSPTRSIFKCFVAPAPRSRKVFQKYTTVRHHRLVGIFQWQSSVLFLCHKVNRRYRSAHWGAIVGIQVSLSYQFLAASLRTEDRSEHVAQFV